MKLFNYRLTSDLADKLYNQSLSIKHLKFEDVFIGILALNLNITFIDISFMWYYATETIDFKNFKMSDREYLFFYQDDDKIKDLMINSDRNFDFFLKFLEQTDYID